jgi:exopolyphosphatase/guanosine-5'-triphosphate,3'-diphosphate pyrophosphatase
MVAYVSGHLRDFKGRGKLKQMIAEHPVHLIGTSGTVTTLAGLHLGLERYERQKVDGLWMTNGQIDETMSALLGMPYERRVQHACIGRDRADLVLPGCAIFEAIRREWPTNRVRVADRGLREGILISLIDADRAHRPPRGR